jgi:hypothetical protein
MELNYLLRIFDFFSNFLHLQSGGIMPTDGDVGGDEGQAEAGYR